MRAVFTVKIQGGPEGYFPSDEDVVVALRRSGWEPRFGPFWEYFCDAAAAECSVGEMAAAEMRVRALWYTEQAHKAFEAMPEVAADSPERDSVVYFGRLPETDTCFAVTRVVMGELKFRLLQDELLDLQASTDRIVRSILKQDLFVSIIRGKVEIYERGRDRVLLTGKVISNVLREAYRRDSRDVALATVPFLLFLAVFPLSVAVAGELEPHVASLIERFSTAMLTTTIVSSLGFLSVLLRLRRESIVEWEYGR
ncbi:MAG: hypothetical protein HY876_00705 [Coriobacteriales bacterium]|nr:hypothetical protein [Coriobacteriales bacterium]